MTEMQTRDVEAIWHPCSQMKDYEDFPPVVIEKGRGAYLYDYEGNRYLDAVSSWWVNLFGHSNPRLNGAIREQLENLEHVIFANFTHKPAVELAENILNIAPKGLARVFFADNGSSAVEVALKLSYHYHQLSGFPEKRRFVALSGGYHGETLGALSLGGLDMYNNAYKPILMDVFHAEGPDCYRCPFGGTRENCNAECFANMEKLIAENHREICGIIVEPMIQAAAGMRIYSAKYLTKLKELCAGYRLHLIADEIASGFGRTGRMFALEHAAVTPDIMCLSKGLTAGYLPLSLTVMTEEIYRAFYSNYTEGKSFLHSHSYTGNPLACSVALESLNIFKEEDVLKKNSTKSKVIRNLAMSAFEGKPYVGEYRQLGMVGAVELVRDKKTKEGFDWKERIGYRIYQKALRKGLILRPLGNVLYFMPPYIIERADIEFMIQTTAETIDEFFRSYKLF